MPDVPNFQAMAYHGRARLTRWNRWLDSHALTYTQLLLVFLAVAVLLIGRKPTAFSYAQFYAEDGHTWYAQAYNLGWLSSLSVPDAGYLNTLPRLGAGLALLAPFRWAPLMNALFGLVIQCLPVLVLLSARARTWGPLSTRLVFALIYVLTPNAGEIHLALTNTQWHLSLVAVLLVFSEPPPTVFAAAGDLICIAVLGLSGPFSILLTPVFLLYWWYKRQRWTVVLASLTVICAAVETYVILHSQSIRYRGELGASFTRILRMVASNVVSTSLLGARGTNRIHGIWINHVPHLLAGTSLLWLAMIASAGVFIYVYVLRKGPLPLRLLTLYALLMLAASLRSPLISGPKPLWELLIENTNGRYWFTPMIALLWGAVWCMKHADGQLARRTATVMLCCLPIGMVCDYRYRAEPDLHFPAEYDMVRRAAPGSRVTFTIPPGGDWDVTLIKRGPVGTVAVH